MTGAVAHSSCTSHGRWCYVLMQIKCGELAEISILACGSGIYNGVDA